MTSNIEFNKTSFLHGINGPFIESLYDSYLDNPEAVPSDWKIFFSSIESGLPKKIPRNIVSPISSIKPSFDPINLSEVGSKIKVTDVTKQSTIDSVRAIMMIRAYRVRGHLIANLDPLCLKKLEIHQELNPKTYGFNDKDLNRNIFLDKVLGLETATLREILEILKKTYCSTIGVEFMHISDPQIKSWIQRKIEGKDKEPSFTAQGKKFILSKLIQAEIWEKFLNLKYTGTKRFGIDGAESLIPALEQIIKKGGSLGVEQIVVGMPHRGRLNVLANLLGKPFQAIFHEFAGGSATPEDIGIQGISSDVKYHLGASGDREFDGNTVHLTLTSNPSHLEAVDPVVLGRVRAKQDLRDRNREKVIPLLLHGDAAFSGQGIVSECFSFSDLPGFRTGGTIHFIINNQIGFTTTPNLGRSSTYPSEIAKVASTPIFHVNGDDPEAVVFVSRLATEFRQKFHRDIVIDMFCYRRFGHNEGDDPSFTQPIMYRKIKEHPTAMELYGKKLVKENLISEDSYQKMQTGFFQYLEGEFISSKNYKPTGQKDWFKGKWSGLGVERGKDKRGKTGVKKDKLEKNVEKIMKIPSDFTPHRMIPKIYEKKRNLFYSYSGKLVDWATAESLAFATLLEEGFPIRISGQDTARGTFSQRHSCLVDQENEKKYLPLNNLSSDQEKFEVIDSLLSEMAVLGFEYGYSLDAPKGLVIWEAQYGDFSNGAQVIIDQFISSGEAKWIRASGIVMLLPHGYEGQGPEHSSARLERYLQLCAQNNMQVVNCTTPANYFHILRRQVIRKFRKPLIIMTPKSLLRHKRCISSIKEMSETTTFHRFLNDGADKLSYSDSKIILKKDEDIKRVIICSGKIYYDLFEEREKNKKTDIYFLRIEQLYPFPVKSLVRELKRFTSAKFFWCQEEPKNMGAWNMARAYINRTLKIANFNNVKVHYIGRDPSASPSTGLAKKHSAEQNEIINKVFL